ncbi:UNKNOWN [Stylonychia lemnae]|uniref:Transmembrane protein n=1 Tax=Stylonychia lemnae TaxID=5949 RepID=A0A078ADS4_STYLE|nr:UNKNOWN [Stylonychia lemnae]|eukprot:CDW79996.1 UNKNOWN [Stylonychia lemnae]
MDFVVMILTAVGFVTFLMPSKDKYWVLLLRFFLVDIPRLASFVLLLRFQASQNTRLFMFVARFVTLPIEGILFIYAYKSIKGASIGMVFYYGFFLLMNIYFGFMIYKYFLTTSQEEIQIELERLGEEQVDVITDEQAAKQRIMLDQKWAGNRAMNYDSTQQDDLSPQYKNNNRDVKVTISLDHINENDEDEGEEQYIFNQNGLQSQVKDKKATPANRQNQLNIFDVNPEEIHLDEEYLTKDYKQTNNEDKIDHQIQIVDADDSERYKI